MTRRVHGNYPWVDDPHWRARYQEEEAWLRANANMHGEPFVAPPKPWKGQKIVRPVKTNRGLMHRDVDVIESGPSWWREAKRTGVCERCTAHVGARKLSRHHIKPRRLGGTSDRDNMIVVCKPCHVELDYEAALQYPSQNALASVLGQMARLPKLRLASG